MSSFIHSEKHFRFIQTAIKTCLKSQDIYNPLNMYAIPYELRDAYRYDKTVINKFVNALIKANVKAVNKQYKIKQKGFTIPDVEDHFEFSSIDFVKALQGLDYQIETWSDKKTKEMLANLRLAVAERYCSTREGYEESKFRAL